MGGTFRDPHRAAIHGTPGQLLPRMALGLSGLLVLLLSACSLGGGGQVTYAKDQTFTWPYEFQVSTLGGFASKQHGEVLDPAVVGYAEDVPTISMIYAPLVTFDSQLHVVPDAATWDVDNTGTVYTFHLRNNMHFSDGTPLTSADYAYGIDRALDPTLCDPANLGNGDGKTYAPNPQFSTRCFPVGPYYLSLILGSQSRGHSGTVISKGDDPKHGINIVDDFTLKIRLSAPVAFFLDALTYPTALPIEHSLVDRYPGGLWVDHLNEGGCSGPFKIKSYGDGTQITLEPNPYWAEAWGKRLTITEVRRPLATSIEQGYANFKAGQYDMARVPGSSYSNARSLEGFHEVPLLAIEYFALNFQQPPFDSPEVRQAFALALNKQIIVNHIYEGGALPTNHIVPRGMPGFNPDVTAPDGTETLTGDQKSAQTKMQAAIQQCKAGGQLPDFCPYILSTNGAALKEVDIVYSTDDDTRRAITEWAAQQWSDILNLKVVAQPAVSQTFAQNTQQAGGPYQAWIIGWLADYPDPQDWLTLQFHTNSALNVEGMSNASLDKLMDQADREKDPSKRYQLYNQAERTVVANLVPWIPLDQPKWYWLQRPWVTGFGLNSLLTMVDLNWPNVAILSH
jgi:peptide/nickel transport system substrate-binding protein/oligopeptide transport system substrate-binding protein